MRGPDHLNNAVDIGPAHMTEQRKAENLGAELLCLGELPLHAGHVSEAGLPMKRRVEVDLGSDVIRIQGELQLLVREPEAVRFNTNRKVVVRAPTALRDLLEPDAGHFPEAVDVGSHQFASALDVLFGSCEGHHTEKSVKLALTCIQSRHLTIVVPWIAVVSGDPEVAGQRCVLRGNKSSLGGDGDLRRCKAENLRITECPRMPGTDLRSERIGRITESSQAQLVELHAEPLPIRRVAEDVDGNHGRDVLTVVGRNLGRIDVEGFAIAIDKDRLYPVPEQDMKCRREGKGGQQYFSA